MIFLGSKNFSSRVFCFFTFVESLWITLYAFKMASGNEVYVNFIFKIEFVLGIMVCLGFYYFSKTYPSDKHPNHWLLFLLTSVTAFFYWLFLHTSFMVGSAYLVDSPQRWGWVLKPGIWLYVSAFFIFCIMGLYNVYKNFTHSDSSLEKVNLRHMFVALTFGLIPPSIFDVILPVFGQYKWSWLGPVLSTFWIFIIANSIIRYRQMNVRIVVAEAIVLAIILSSFLNIFSEFPFQVYGRLGLFVIVFCLGLFLIISLLKQERQKKELEVLNGSLSKKVAEQTQDVQRAYEIEKKIRIELELLDQNKNDFIIVTQHHLRTPLSQIRWYASSILNGIYGNIPEELKQAIVNIDGACGRLVKTLNDFLNITQLKIGTRTLTLTGTNLQVFFEKIIRDFSFEISRKKLKIVYLSQIYPAFAGKPYFFEAFLFCRLQGGFSAVYASCW